MSSSTYVEINTVTTVAIAFSLVIFFALGLMFSRRASLKLGAALAVLGVFTIIFGALALGIVATVIGGVMCLVGIAAGEN